ATVRTRRGTARRLRVSARTRTVKPRGAYVRRFRGRREGFVGGRWIAALLPRPCPHHRDVRVLTCHRSHAIFEIGGTSRPPVVRVARGYSATRFSAIVVPECQC